MVNQQDQTGNACTEQVARARREAIAECVRLAERILPGHDDLNCCFGLRQNILSALRERLREAEEAAQALALPPEASHSS